MEREIERPPRSRRDKPWPRGRDRKGGREKGLERATRRAEHNGPPRRFGNVGTRNSEWETNEESAPAGSQDNACRENEC